MINKSVLEEAIERGLRNYLGDYKGFRHYDLIYIFDDFYWCFHYSEKDGDIYIGDKRLKDIKEDFVDVDLSIGDMDELKEVYFGQV